MLSRNPLTFLRQTQASSSRQTLPPLLTLPTSIFNFLPITQQVRFRSNLAPRRTKYKKSQKGLPITLPTGGSIKGTTLNDGIYGLRLLSSARLSASVLTACQETLKRKLKPVKGCRIFMRVFPDIPVCVKGNEVRMGKGKGSFEFWATRVRAGKVVFEVGGGGVREEVAKQALKLVQDKLPVKAEFITTLSPPRLGSLASHDLHKPASAMPIPALYDQMKGREVGGGWYKLC